MGGEWCAALYRGGLPSFALALFSLTFSPVFGRASPWCKSRRHWNPCSVPRSCSFSFPSSCSCSCGARVSTLLEELGLVAHDEHVKLVLLVRVAQFPYLRFLIREESQELLWVGAWPSAAPDGIDNFYLIRVRDRHGVWPSRNGAEAAQAWLRFGSAPRKGRAR